MSKIETMNTLLKSTCIGTRPQICCNILKILDSVSNHIHIVPTPPTYTMTSQYSSLVMYDVAYIPIGL